VEDGYESDTGRIYKANYELKAQLDVGPIDRT
jgi:hypothetical protein